MNKLPKKVYIEILDDSWDRYCAPGDYYEAVLGEGHSSCYNLRKLDGTSITWFFEETILESIKKNHFKLLSKNEVKQLVQDRFWDFL